MKLVTVHIYIYIWHSIILLQNIGLPQDPPSHSILGISFKLHANSHGRKSCPAYSCFCFLIPLMGLAYRRTGFGDRQKYLQGKIQETGGTICRAV